MSLIVGIEPERSIKSQMHNIAVEVVRLVEMQGVPVNHIDPNNYHIELFPIPARQGSFRWLLNKRVLKRFRYSRFDISFSTVKLGSGGRMKEFIYLQAEEGSDQLRKMVFDLAQRMGVRRVRTFNPAIRVAKIVKDLSDQEIHNLHSSLREYDQIHDNNVKFEFTDLSVLAWKNDQLTEVKKFDMMC